MINLFMALTITMLLLLLYLVYKTYVVLKLTLAFLVDFATMVDGDLPYGEEKQFH